MALYDSILDTVGNTPIVKLQRLAPPQVSVYAKVESFNPGGSVRTAWLWRSSSTLKRVACSSRATPSWRPPRQYRRGTGDGRRSARASSWRPWSRPLGRAPQADACLWCQVILTPAAERGSGMVRKAAELAEQHGWFLASQFANPANPAYHRNTTAAEILRDFAGKRLDYFVSGWGTGGTLTGVGEVLKVARPQTRIIATEPAGAALLKGDDWKPHKIQGWTPDFVPDVLNRDVVDELVSVEDDRAIATARRLAAEEGIFVGISAGATVASALDGCPRRTRLGDPGDAAGHW